MQEYQVRDIALNGVYQNARINGSVTETHISWVILSGKFVFKIKKPVKLDFLDFSSIQLRKQACEKELHLNSRFSDIYLAVLPVCLVNDQWVIGDADDAHVIDYCVAMRRMAESKRMDNMVRNGTANEPLIKTLATAIASFHNHAEKIFSPFDIEGTRGLFNDIESLYELASKEMGVQFGEIIHRAIAWSNHFLEIHEDRFQQRIDHGLKRDVHGDLHCANIFLYKNPVLFDCIEFNDQFRQIDVLYEIAFLCMDLESFHQKKHLADLLLREYRKHFPAFQKKEDYWLFVYFKSLRANIRAKVHAMQWSQAGNLQESPYHLAEARRYLVLMNGYMAKLLVLA